MQLIKYVNFFFILILASSQLTAQDSILLKNGDEITGSFEINYKNSGDELVSVDGSQVISAAEVDEFKKYGALVYTAQNISFYSASSNSESQKYALLELGLQGEVNLYFYEGENFSLVLERDGDFKALQELPTTFTSDNLQNYKINLLTTLSDCLEREKIFDAELSRSAIISYVNTFNLCMDSTYAPLITASKKTSYINFDFNIGINSSSLDMDITVLDNQGRDIGSVFADGAKSNAFYTGLTFSKNLFDTKNIYFISSIGVKSLDYTLKKTGTVNLRPKNLKVTEIDFNAGLNYRFFEANKFSFEMSSGVNVWFLGGQETIRNSIDSVLPSGTRKDYGFGFFVKPGFVMGLSEKSSLLFNVSYTAKLDDSVFTFNKDGFPGNTLNPSDTVSGNLAFLLGLRFDFDIEKFEN